MLHGRAGELAAINYLLDQARKGHSGSVVLRGEAGIGKSALLEYAAAQARGFTVLRATGVESEAEFAFATLHQLLRPIQNGIDQLPSPQASALRAAFGLAPTSDEGDQRFLVAVAVLTLLTDTAEQAPVLCLTDDAHWADRSSTDVLLFVARRLAAEGVALIFAARDDLEFRSPAVPELALGGLDISRHFRCTSPRLLSRCSSSAVSGRNRAGWATPSGVIRTALLSRCSRQLWLCGVIRVIWHMPLLAYGTIPWYDFVFGIFALQIIFTWLYNGAGASVLIAMIAHLFSNVMTATLKPLFSPAEQQRYWLILVVVQALTALGLLIATRGRLGLSKCAAHPLRISYVHSDAADAECKCLMRSDPPAEYRRPFGPNPEFVSGRSTRASVTYQRFIPYFHLINIETLAALRWASEEREATMNDSDRNDGPALDGSSVDETLRAADAVGGPRPVPWPPIDWPCMRWTGISGRYTGIAIPSTILRSERLELRLDIDPRYSADSPVMNKVSGDHFTRVFKPFPPGFGPEVYSHSWIVDRPVVTWVRCSATITGDVRFFSGSRPATTVKIVVNWSLGAPTTATVTFSGGVTDTYVGMTFEGDSFRTLELEVDYCASVNVAPLAPSYGTHQHNNHPAALSNRTLTIASVYREAGVDLRFTGGSSVVNDSAPGFATWNVAELHDAMETAFSQYTSGWPNWRMWGLQVGAFDSSTLGGIMFDAPAVNQGAGERPDRQGFAIARNHSWFTDLVASPSTQVQYEAMRKYLYVWVHEAGHAWNLLHSWDKGRPSALSWMNYDWKYDAINGADTFWARFFMRFDDEELIHMRHGDRKTVIMGGDDWGTGGHLEAPPAAALEAGPGQPLELMVRCRPYVMLMEPVSVELRLRNTTPVPIPVDARLDPRYGTTTIVVSRPDGTWIDYTSVMCMLGDAQTLTLAPAPVAGAPEGPDRYSEHVPLTFGSSGFVFDLPGTYRIKAVYNDGLLTAVSNVATLRIGAPMTRDEDRLAAEWFTNAVGLTVALGGSMSPHLDPGLDTLREAADRFANNDVGMAAAQVLAVSVGDDFYRREGDEVVRFHEADPDAALALTEGALQAHKTEGDKTTNLAYRTLVEQRADLHVAAGRPAQARKELSSLATALSRRGANPNVVADVKAEAESLGTDGRPPAG